MEATHERRSPKMLSRSLSSCVQHVIQTVNTRMSKPTIQTEQVSQESGRVGSKRTFAELSAADQSDDWNICEIQEA